MTPTNPLKNSNGLAMVLALSLTGLLSLLGIWLLLQAKTAFRVTTATTRYESVFNLAEAALQLSMRCVQANTIYPTFANFSGTTELTAGLPACASPSPSSFGNGLIIPGIDPVGYGDPPPGWSMVWHGYSSYHSVFYKLRGEGQIELPSSQGDSKTAVLSFATKISH